MELLNDNEAEFFDQCAIATMSVLLSNSGNTHFANFHGEKEKREAHEQGAKRCFEIAEYMTLERRNYPHKYKFKG